MKQMLLKIFDRFRKVPEGHKLFRGHYHDGEAVYTYLPNPDNEKHIIDGYFKVKYKYGRHKFAEAKGTYANDIKQGHWEFVRDGFSTYRSLSADFIDGQIVGSVVCMLSEVGIGSVQVSKLSLTVKNGNIVGPVTGVVRNEVVPENYEANPQMVNLLNYVLSDCIPVLLSLAPRGHVSQYISIK